MLTPIKRLVTALVGGGLAYFCWMAAFLLTAGGRGELIEIILWLVAPLITSAGFTAGVLIFNRLAKAPGDSFWRIFLWPLAGCVIGAGVFYWFGPMLIVFGMLMFGLASLILRELVMWRRQLSESM